MTRSHAWLLALGIVLLLTALGAEFLFQQSFHPVWDSAANALSVGRAKRFEQLYGPYSRWGFHHPGPAMFYVQALGEWLFYDTLKWVGSPVAGQTLAHAALMSGFFVAALRVFARAVPAGRRRWWFVCGALALAIPHFAAMGRIPSYDVLRGPSALMSLWSAHALVLPFLVLLTAGASVASGRGEDLPTLALAGGYLLHLHVAQPMFVLPVFALGYAGLLRQVNGPRRGSGGTGAWWRLPVRAWGAFPRAHALAAVVLVVFALPFVLDFCRGGDGNTALILKHLERYSTHKPLERAVFYFAMFGAYTAFNPADNEFAFYDRAGLWAYGQAHAGLLACWVGVAVVVVGTLLAGLRRWARTRGTPPAPSPPGDGGAGFRAWAAGFCLLAVGLTLRWNVRQDDQMFYFNSWFTFAIYGFGAWIALAAGCSLPGSSRFDRADRRPRHHPGPNGAERLTGACLILAVVGWHLDGLRWRDPTPAATAAMRADLRRLQEAAGATGPPPGTDPDAAKMLRFDYPVSPVAAAAALQLARDGVPFFTVNQWAVYLGLEHAWSRVPERTLRSGRLETWRFAHRARLPGLSAADDLPITTVPYLREFFQAADDIVVRRSEPPVDPAADGGGAAIRFGPGGEATPYAVGGWFTADDGRVWMDDPRAMLAFRPVPLPVTAGDGGTVEITLTGFTSMVTPPAWPRLRVFLNSEPLGDDGPTLTGAGKSLTYRVPATVWNQRASGSSSSAAEPPRSQLLLEIPEAISGGGSGLPKPPGQRGPIGLGLREVRFRWVPPAPAPGGP